MTAPMTTAPDKEPDKGPSEGPNEEPDKATSLEKPPSGDRPTTTHQAPAA